MRLPLRTVAFVSLFFCFQVLPVLADEDCFDEFSKSICVVDDDGAKLCGREHASNLAYIEKIHSVFDYSLPISRKLMCSLNEIRIVDELQNADGRYSHADSSISLASRILDEDFWIEDSIYFQAVIFVEDDEDRRYFARPYSHADSYLATSDVGELFVIMTHELGHHLEEIATLGNGFLCAYKDEPVSQYSSEYALQIKRTINLAGDENIPASSAEAFYDWLDDSPFVSPYALRNTAEDFAETFLYYELFEKTTIALEIELSGHKIFSTRSDSYKKAKARKFADLQRMIDAVLADDETIGLKMVTCAD